MEESPWHMCPVVCLLVDYRCSQADNHDLLLQEQTKTNEDRDVRFPTCFELISCTFFSSALTPHFQ